MLAAAGTLRGKEDDKHPATYFSSRPRGDRGKRASPELLGKEDQSQEFPSESKIVSCNSTHAICMMGGLRGLHKLSY